jgi:hypothetical protein
MFKTVVWFLRVLVWKPRLGKSSVDLQTLRPGGVTI